jgi:hypothetical protein
MTNKLCRGPRTLARVGAMLLCLVSWQASGATFSTTGTFALDDDLFSIPFALTSQHDVTLRTFGYAGGTNGVGQLIPAGGFDPIVSIFDSLGHLVGISDDGIGVPVDPTSGAAHDSLVSLLLDAGQYLAVLSQFDNFPNGDLADGFSESGQGHFTAGFGCGSPGFCDAEMTSRTANFALDLIGVDAVPEPAALALALTGLALMTVIRRRVTD